MYALLLLLTTVVSCILLAPGLHEKLKSVPFCKDGDGGGDNENSNFLDKVQDQFQESVTNSYQFNCADAVGYLAVYRYVG